MDCRHRRGDGPAPVQFVDQPVNRDTAELRRLNAAARRQSDGFQGLRWKLAKGLVGRPRA